ncbi:uncharacterized protein LOC129312375 [Prosopis cineraria]|uniref:uncharacterized protein LOC129312375 n=1 Tax=Prosopis cineraria TaxID=364024 RepID=UPI00240F5325|nr:uncharacterized protein LOC129312375 [Prosopis cineraria]XP_054810921.1 uncharacterized protein LOC129312375 [Prosopis cineraria]XP_054810922.1 uncharacterized protein LOC129312375 [Prosopis cineraria]XP_054810923.1 uncharacterized protein LOC129312375 [Prosopis cineraria]XP_054810924.1 uncharacterized protein LOC129312375 [Prosopis cineraria]XP_054810925.1 uncharacterized protein LOC129312375 [Prosopis cineraria]XP_054810926.1 uncharacterized protein LOC129312375 [Prosopis cineraria]
MDSDSLKRIAPARRKVKFAPKAPPRRVPKAEVKTEVVDDADAVQAKDLLHRFNESSMRAKPKLEKKVLASQIAFGIGGSSASIKSYGAMWGASHSGSSQSSAFTGVREKVYQEPWDYYSCYPVTVPLRRPYSGNPELLDEEEFGEAAESLTYDENSSNPAIDLGLLEENPEASLFLLQLPPALPMNKQSATARAQDAPSRSKPPVGTQPVEKPCNLNQLPSGLLGKLLVYKSGAVKLKLGDTLYDISSGMDCVFAQDVVAVNTTEKHCCTVGEISKHVTITPDIDAIIESVADL